MQKEVTLEPVTLEGLKLINKDRFKDIEILRTPYPTTEAHQEAFFKSMPNRRDVVFFNIKHKKNIVGVGGFCNYEPENQLAELSLLIRDKYRRSGLGYMSVYEILKYGFNVLNIKNIYGECYKSSKSLGFWDKCLLRLSDMYEITRTVLPNRKKIRDTFFDSVYFNIAGC